MIELALQFWLKCTSLVKIILTPSKKTKKWVNPVFCQQYVDKYLQKPQNVKSVWFNII